MIENHQQEESIQNILANPVVSILSTSDHVRYYVEGYIGHCLIDIEKSETLTGNVLNTLTMTRYGPGAKSERVKLTNKEIDDLLTILLQWHLSHMEDK